MIWHTKVAVEPHHTLYKCGKKSSGFSEEDITDYGKHTMYYTGRKKPND